MIQFEVYVDCEEISDSVQIESGTRIAMLKIDDGREVTIETRGEVCIEFCGKEYCSVSEFPMELKYIIANNKLWYKDEDIYMHNRNRFEMLYKDDYEDGYFTVDDDMHIEGFTDAEIYEVLADYLNGAEDYEHIPEKYEDFIKGNS